MRIFFNNGVKVNSFDLVNFSLKTMRRIEGMKVTKPSCMRSKNAIVDHAYGIHITPLYTNKSDI
jgi:hypothetical protein